MRSGRIVFCALVASAALAACSAPTPEETDNSLKAATALAVQNTNFEKIEILNKELQKAKWVWQARVDGKTYACDADDQMRLPSCQAAG
jgi:hypothetical protein